MDPSDQRHDSTSRILLFILYQNISQNIPQTISLTRCSARTSFLGPNNLGDPAYCGMFPREQQCMLIKALKAFSKEMAELLFV